jgi:hypothetical protein
MSTNREMYDTIVAEVERDYVHVFEHDMGEVPNLDEEGFVQYEVLDGLLLDTPTDAFSNFAVRDAIMVKANEDDKVAFVLCNKIIHHAKKADDAGNFVQADLDALATAIHIQAMWEQTERAIGLSMTAEQCAEENNLEMPTIMDATKRVIMMQAVMGLDIADLRVRMTKDLAKVAFKALDSE